MPKVFRWKVYDELVCAEDATSASRHINSKFCFAKTNPSDFEEIMQDNYAQAEQDSRKTIVKTMKKFEENPEIFNSPFIFTH